MFAHRSMAAICRVISAKLWRPSCKILALTILNPHHIVEAWESVCTRNQLTSAHWRSRWRRARWRWKARCWARARSRGWAGARSPAPPPPWACCSSAAPWAGACAASGQAWAPACVAMSLFSAKRHFLRAGRVKYSGIAALEGQALPPVLCILADWTGACAGPSPL